MHPPHGPFKIGANRQITIPADLMRKVRLAPGDAVYVIEADDIEGSLVVVPVERLVGWADAGRRFVEHSDPSKSGPKEGAH